MRSRCRLMCSRALSSRRSEATGVWSAKQVTDPSLGVQVELVHLVVAPDHLATDRRVAARKGLQRPFQQQPGLGACPLDLALKGAQLLMKAPPDLAHQPNLPVLSPSVPWLSTLTVRSAARSSTPLGDTRAARPTRLPIEIRWPAARDRQPPASRADRPRRLAITSSYCPLPALRPSWPDGGSCRPG